MLYSVYCLYSLENANAILDGSLFEKAHLLHPALIGLLPDGNCPETLRSKVYQMVLKLRQEQTFQSLPFDLYGDCLYIDSIISDDTCIASFDKHGYLDIIQSEREIPQYNLLASDLTEIFYKAFPTETK